MPNPEDPTPVPTIEVPSKLTPASIALFFLTSTSASISALARSVAAVAAADCWAASWLNCKDCAN